MKKTILLHFLFLLISVTAIAQGTIRGNVYDKESGGPVIYANVLVEGTDLGATSDLDGFFTIANVPEGTYNLMVTYVGFDSLTTSVKVFNRGIAYKSLYLESSSVELADIVVSARSQQARTEVQISSLNISSEQIEILPATGGEPDIAQYLQVIPGVISTGAQGGQIYIRGGTPVQNKILLDGMTIYNPFHSIGFFSVFETEAIRNVEVLTGGFGAEYGGRVSAIVDIKTKEGQRKKLGGLVSASPFQVKALVEGPIIPLTEERNNSLSFLLTGKRSILPETSPSLYDYAIIDSIGSLPFDYQDLYGKLSFVGGNGSKINLFGFQFNDEVRYPGIANYDWDAVGGGMNFSLIPSSSNLLVDGILSYSSYKISELVFNGEGETTPRTSSVNDFGIKLNFGYFGAKSEVNYGLSVNGFTTDFVFENPFGIDNSVENNNTELAAYFKYKHNFGRFIMEPSVRVHYYASLGQASVEPRVGLKYNFSDRFRAKAAGGLYSQNLASSINERDVVNLFSGFLTTPDLQRGIHGVLGFEFDLFEGANLNVEGYYKGYDPLYQLNRDRRSQNDPEFVSETGEAYGIDFLLTYDWKDWYLWGTYSYGYIWRENDDQRYPAVFDRRHNINLVLSYSFGKDKSWEAGARWNFGTGFNFTQILGFVERQDHDNIYNNPVVDNGRLIPFYSDQLNRGVLPDYHRLDLTLKKTWDITKDVNIEANFSVTNAYDRENILFVNPLRTEDKLFQLPVLPSFGLKVEF